LLYTSCISFSSSEPATIPLQLDNAIGGFAQESSDHYSMVKVTFKIHETNCSTKKLRLVFIIPQSIAWLCVLVRHSKFLLKVSATTLHVLFHVNSRYF
jgi:hypothetical protein